MDKFASVKNRNYTANPTQPLLHGPLRFISGSPLNTKFFFSSFFFSFLVYLSWPWRVHTVNPCNLTLWCRCYDTTVQYTCAGLPVCVAHGVVLVLICINVGVKHMQCFCVFGAPMLASMNQCMDRLLMYAHTIIHGCLDNYYTALRAD